jgi:hypothetical protein
MGHVGGAGAAAEVGGVGAEARAKPLEGRHRDTRQLEGAALWRRERLWPNRPSTANDACSIIWKVGGGAGTRTRRMLDY